MAKATQRLAHHPRRLNRSGKLSAKTIFQNGYDLGAAERRRVHGRVGLRLVQEASGNGRSPCTI
jgi:hypothetical protein